MDIVFLVVITCTALSPNSSVDKALSLKLGDPGLSSRHKNSTTVENTFCCQLILLVFFTFRGESVIIPMNIKNNSQLTSKSLTHCPNRY